MQSSSRRVRSTKRCGPAAAGTRGGAEELAESSRTPSAVLGSDSTLGPVKGPRRLAAFRPSPFGRLTSPGDSGADASAPAVPWRSSVSLTPAPGATSAALKDTPSISTPPAATNLSLTFSSSALGDTPRLRQSSTHRSSPPANPTRTGLNSDTMHASISALVSSPTSCSAMSSPREMFHSCVRPSMMRLSTTATRWPRSCSVAAAMSPSVPPHTTASKSGGPPRFSGAVTRTTVGPFL
mmetsp:Transcript_34644/g.87673  ORF Transcript_34644/g.87673 Transcript_34644/m.87673 type:complete len:238 (+) Transcript_34644:3677-4390(+)